jgi:hypothetical protein
VAAVAERASSPLARLPHALMLAVYDRLPVDARARCKLVCRGWNSMLSEVRGCVPRLDLSRSSGVRVRVTDAVLRGASGLARGGLTALDVSDCRDVTYEALLAAATANAGALAELRIVNCFGQLALLPCPNIEALLRAAPLLRALHADARCSMGAQARALLRNEPPFGPLRMSHMTVAGWPVGTDAERIAAVIAFSADLVAHASLSSLFLDSAPLQEPAALDAIVDAVLLRRLRICRLANCRLSPASAPSLARLLSSDALVELQIESSGMPLLDAPAAALLAEALRANSTLTSLKIDGAALWGDAPAATALLGALTAHGSICSLQFHNAIIYGEATVDIGAALGALVAANAPALTSLDVLGICGDEALRPLLRALLRNTHLRELRFCVYELTDAFKREVLLPAARANTSLRSLSFSNGGGAACVEAQALVAARAAAEQADNAH